MAPSVGMDGWVLVTAATALTGCSGRACAQQDRHVLVASVSFAVPESICGDETAV
jgi:hypothetical protein